MYPYNRIFCQYLMEPHAHAHGYPPFNESGEAPAAACAASAGTKADKFYKTVILPDFIPFFSNTFLVSSISLAEDAIIA